MPGTATYKYLCKGVGVITPFPKKIFREKIKAKNIFIEEIIILIFRLNSNI